MTRFHYNDFLTNDGTQVARVLAWLTECELATLEYLRGLKRPAKMELKRHEKIAKRAVDQCYDLKVPPIGLLGFSGCPRLAEEYEKKDRVHGGVL